MYGLPRRPSISRVNRVTIRMPEAVTIAVPRRLIGLRVRAAKKLFTVSASPFESLFLLLLHPGGQGAELFVAAREGLGVLLAPEVALLPQELDQHRGVLLGGVVGDVRALHLLGLGGGLDAGRRDRVAHVALLGQEERLAVQRLG